MLNTLRQVSRAVRQPQHSVAHVRCIMDNVGDRLVDEAIQSMLGEMTLVDYTPSRKIGLAEHLVPGPLFRYTCLGGGTLIYGDIHRGWGVALESALERTELAFAFGTGVVDTEFRDDLARRFGKRPIAAGSYDRWNEALRRFRWIGVRGDESKARLDAAGIDGVEVTGDPVLYYTRDAWTPRASNRHVGLNVANRSYFFGDANDRVAPILSGVLTALIDRGFRVTLFPMTPEDDAITAEVIDRAGAPAVEVFEGYRSTRALLDRLAELDVFCGLRLHAVASAVCMLTPSVMVGYQPKNREFMDTLGLSDQYVQIDRTSTEEIVELIASLHDRADTVRDLQRDACRPYRQRLLDLRDRVVASV